VVVAGVSCDRADERFAVAGSNEGTDVFDKLIVAVLALIAADAASACSPARGYRPFLSVPTSSRAAALSPPPRVTVDKIERGYGDSNVDCSNLGVLVLKVPAETIAGYTFEIVTGRFDSEIPFPRGFVQPITRGQLRFVWLDGANSPQEPLDVVVKITALSATGALSEPKYLRVQDPGGVRAGLTSAPR
jgi:hypothetical protein